MEVAVEGELAVVEQRLRPIGVRKGRMMIIMYLIHETKIMS